MDTGYLADEDIAGRGCAGNLCGEFINIDQNRRQRRTDGIYGIEP